FPARLPEHLVAAEEREVDSRGACGLHIRSLLSGPVFVVAGGEEHLVLLDQAAASRTVDAGRIRDVVTGSLEEADHRVLRSEDPAGRLVRTRRRGPVVADLVGAVRRIADRGVAAGVQAVRETRVAAG